MAGMMTVKRLRRLLEDSRFDNMLVYVIRGDGLLIGKGSDKIEHLIDFFQEEARDVPGMKLPLRETLPTKEPDDAPVPSGDTREEKIKQAIELVRKEIGSGDSGKGSNAG